MNIGIIGFGKMGEAIAKGILKKKKDKLYYAEAKTERVRFISTRFPQIKHLNVAQLVDTSNIIIIALKPQDIEGVLCEINNVLKREKLVISIAAGISTRFIERKIKRARVVRAMPNMGALIGRSFTAIAGGKTAKTSDIKEASKIFSSIGAAKEVNENLIDAITAVIGGGPAYAAYFIKALQDVCKEVGLSKLAKDIVLEYFETTPLLLKMMNLKPEELIENVKSPGGTTQACLSLWDEEKLCQIIKRGVKKAYARSKELEK